jgi:hypothetical protein
MTPDLSCSNLAIKNYLFLWDCFVTSWLAMTRLALFLRQVLWK